MFNSVKNYLALFLFAFLISSCTPVISELWLNKDESGKMETTFDLGEMAGMAQGMLSEMGGEENKNEGPGLWDKEEMIDSTMNFYEVMPDSIKEKMENAEILKNVNLNMYINSKKEEANISMTVEFDSAEQMNEIFNSMKTMKGGGPDSEDQFENMKIDYSFDIKNGIIRIPGMDLSELENDPEFSQIMGSMDSLDTADPEKMEMFEMLFGGETSLIIHAPGNVQFTNDMDAVIDGNKVTFTDNLIEIIKSKKSLDRVIKFKN